MKKQTLAALTILVLAACIQFSSDLFAQLQQSGGPGSTVSIGSALPAGTNLIGKISTDQTTHGTSDLVAADLTKIAGVATATGNGLVGTGVQRVAIASDNTAFSVNVASLPALSTGSSIIGFVRVLPAGCTQTTRFSGDTVGVATGVGTSVTSTTTCVGAAFVNNITNASVTFRLADKSGTPVIWVGGNADFTVPANSNLGLPFLQGVTFTSGITAIAGNASALNLHIEGWQ